ncbi:MAG: hypothetical protein ABMA15_08600 [Vicinamibacterales bacterium]
MKSGKCTALLAIAVAAVMASPVFAQGQQPKDQPVERVHDMEHMDMPGPGQWHLMQDGSISVMANHQGGSRGGDEVKIPNWWMAMATRSGVRGTLTLTGMLSLDPATVGAKGYRELFQVGEALDGRPITDHQHPHDFWMQLSAAWRIPMGNSTSLTISGGPAGEPALGPNAFMHRASAAALLLAPLSHHTFDSTHVAFGVATVGVDRGKVGVEASVFNGREPDQRRWNFDFGKMDSVSARIWYRPTAHWEAQVSSGHLVEPEQLSHGNVVRSTASASYFRGEAVGLMAATVGVGMNRTDDATRHAVFGEASKAWGRTLVSTRIEWLEVESDLLISGEVPHTAEGEGHKAVVGAATLAAMRTVGTVKKMSAAVGASATVFRVPSSLRETHGSRPTSFQVVLQLRPLAGSMGRMWNTHMGGRPMGAAEP